MDIEEKISLVQEKALANQNSYDELRALLGPKFDVDTGDYRRELLTECLVEWGVITQDQFLDFELKFHENVWGQLEQFWEQVRDQQAKAKLIKPRKPVLLGPDGQPL